MADDLQKRFKRLKLPANATVCFLSHHKASGGTVARLLHDRICAILNLPSSAIFLDSNDLGNLSTLPVQVSKSMVLCLLQTSTVLTRPYVLVEVYSALKRNIPIIGVHVEGSGYDFESTAAFLQSPNFPDELETKNPGALKVLQDLNIDVKEMGALLGERIPKVVSVRLSPHENDRILQASIEVITGRILNEIENRAGSANPGILPAIGDVEKQEKAYSSFVKKYDDSSERQPRRCDRKKALLAFLFLLIIGAGVGVGVYFGLVSSSPTHQLFLSDPSIVSTTTAIEYGYSIAINGRGDQIVVGAPGANNEEGAVQILTYNRDTQILSTGIVFTDSGGGPIRFGEKVLSNTEGDFVAIGTRGKDLLIYYQPQTASLLNIQRFHDIRDFDWDAQGKLLVTSSSLSANGTIDTYERVGSDNSQWLFRDSFFPPGPDCTKITVSPDKKQLAIGCPSLHSFAGALYIYRLDFVTTKWVLVGEDLSPFQANIALPDSAEFGNRMSFSQDSSLLFAVANGQTKCSLAILERFGGDAGNWTQLSPGGTVSFGSVFSSSPDGCFVDGRHFLSAERRYVIALPGKSVASYIITAPPNSAEVEYSAPNEFETSKSACKAHSFAYSEEAPVMFMSDPCYDNSRGRVAYLPNLNV